MPVEPTPSDPAPVPVEPVPEPAEPEPPPPAAPAEGSVTVSLADLPNDIAVRMRLIRADGTALPLVRSATGAFVQQKVPIGSWMIEVADDETVLLEQVVEVIAGQTTQVPLSMTTDDDVTEIVVVGLTEASEMRRSAEAVTVVETEEAQRQSADLGEVMARTQGVGVRRGGGLGSGTRFSLNGLTDDQVRFFIDGVPLSLAGYPLGLANVPVDLVRRVEVFRGVVPVRFGADALGGAVNLVSESEQTRTGGSFSYQGGSFDTHRFAANGRGKAGGLRLAGSAYFDTSRNDYVIDVEVPDELGRLSPTEVRRFHDGYQAGGGSVEVGVADGSWADGLTLRAFGAGFRREFQHNVVMTIPYGAPVGTVITGGTMLRYHHNLSESVRIDAFVTPTRTRRTFTDTGDCIVDWFGQCVRDLDPVGELSVGGIDARVFDNNLVGRLRLTWQPSDGHTFELAVSPQTFSRSGENLLLDNEDVRDPLSARRDASQLVSGLEHIARTRDERLENRVFVKHYGQWLRSEEPLPGGTLRDVNRNTQRFGAGNGTRLLLGQSAWLKASYEFATRLPTPDEVFGDAVLVVDNLELQPEQSHNVNLGLTLEPPPGATGRWTLDTQLFGRFANDLIVLLGNSQTFSYFNVFGARSAGLEGSGSWTSPGDVVRLSANATWLEFRNTSDEGTFGDFAGDRIPNRPWLFANASAQIGSSNVVSDEDRLTLDWYTRYVHPFFRGWESVGLVQFKQEIPAQLSHAVAVTYAVQTPQRQVSVSAEVQNLTDEALFDFFGVQRPGRSVFGKITVGL
ncbi:MAG: TonB-dependent siderophore myxochelin receptor MxcH [Myxococcota bacterium]